MNNEDALRKRVAWEITRRHLKHDDVSREAGVSAATVSTFQRGKARPTAATVASIVAWLAKSEAMPDPDGPTVSRETDQPAPKAGPVSRETGPDTLIVPDGIRDPFDPLPDEATRKHYRELSGMHLAEFAAIMHMDTSTVARWERGAVRPSATNEVGYMLLLRLVAMMSTTAAPVSRETDRTSDEWNAAISDAFRRGQEDALRTLVEAPETDLGTWRQIITDYTAKLYLDVMNYTMNGDMQTDVLHALLKVAFYVKTGKNPSDEWQEFTQFRNSISLRLP